MSETIFPYSKIYFHDSKFHYTFAGNLVSLRVISAAPLDFKVFLCQRKVFLCQQKVSPCQRKPAYLLLNGSMTNHMLRSNDEYSAEHRIFGITIVDLSDYVVVTLSISQMTSLT